MRTAPLPRRRRRSVAVTGPAALLVFLIAVVVYLALYVGVIAAIVWAVILVLQHTGVIG